MKISLETKRLLLRPWMEDDYEAMFYGWANDPEVTKYMTWNAHNSIEETKQIINKWIKDYEKPERLNFAIVLKESNELIGGIDIVGYIENTPVIGYNLSKKYWNNGYMTEACKCVIDYLFSSGHKEIRIDAMVENIASNKVIQKCGGVFIKQEKQNRPLKNDTIIVNSYIIKNTE